MMQSLGQALFLAGKVRLQSSCLFMLELARGLGEAGCEVRLLCSGLSAEEEARRQQIRAQEWRALAGPWRLLALGGALRRQLRQWGIQLVHVHGQGLGIFGRRLISAARLPVVFTPQPFGFSPREVRAIQGRAQRVIVMDQGLREDCVNVARIPKDKIALIRQGIEFGATQASPPRVGEHTPVVGAVGPLAKGKGLGLFLKCAQRLIQSGREAQFIIAGDGPEDSTLRRLCRDLELDAAVTFVTRLHHYHAVLESLDIFVRPSMSDGLGFALLKAMAMGKAVVATDVGGMYSLVEDGVTGRLVSRGRYDALAEAIGELLDDPARAQQFGRNAREVVRSHYGLAQAVQETLAVYRDAMTAFGARGAQT